MGVNIDGVIETREADGWDIEIDLLDFGLGRERFAWECLFGTGGALGVERPLFDCRGLPEDVSESVRASIGDWESSHTYATWAEIVAVDWDAPLCDSPAYSMTGEWRPGPEEKLVFHGWVWTPTEVLDAAEEEFGEDLMPPEWPPGGEVAMKDVVYRPVVLTARMFAPPEGSWGHVWAAMRDQAAVYGDENVRLVVWFG
ncbi:hypothetical protein GCM10010425_64310 [Streptomyces spororaveus]|uniref:DUF1877 family protein n=1 Tax=Streptomyces spororaveus TaxID=284039 RepID=A0ABQ3T6V4_9ACTN|nr:hypothetical protein [Streptomyces spororaveus]GHI76123.1 hypothetical protein Sspor_16840 [Streptomyces spororaveus]